MGSLRSLARERKEEINIRYMICLRSSPFGDYLACLDWKLVSDQDYNLAVSEAKRVPLTRTAFHHKISDVSEEYDRAVYFQWNPVQKSWRAIEQASGMLSDVGDMKEHGQP